MADKQQWQGKASANLTRSTADQIWPLFADFYNLHKWHSVLETCQHVESSPNPPQPGCIRQCSGHGMIVCERLLTIDPVRRCLSYEITQDSIGFKNYVATISVLPGDGDDEKGCVIEWGYVVDPIQGWKYEDLFGIISSGLDSMAKKMEEDVAVS